MANREIIAGDSYDYPERRLFIDALATLEGEPFPFAGKIVRATFKPVPDDDPADEAAVIKAEMRFNDDGTVLSTNGLELDPGGQLVHNLTAEQSATIPAGTSYISDVQISRYDPVVGKEVGVYTFMFTDTLVAKLGITNRST